MSVSEYRAIGRVENSCLMNDEVQFGYQMRNTALYSVLGHRNESTVFIDQQLEKDESNVLLAWIHNIEPVYFLTTMDVTFSNHFGGWHVHESPISRIGEATSTYFS